MSDVLEPAVPEVSTPSEEVATSVATGEVSSESSEVAE